MGTKLEFCYIHYQRFTAQEHNSSSSDAVGLNFWDNDLSKEQLTSNHSWKIVIITK